MQNFQKRFEGFFDFMIVILIVIEVHIFQCKDIASACNAYGATGLLFINYPAISFIHSCRLELRDPFPKTCSKSPMTKSIFLSMSESFNLKTLSGVIQKECITSTRPESAFLSLLLSSP